MDTEQLATHMTIPEAARRLGVSRFRVNYWVRVGLLEAVRVSEKLYMIPVAAVTKFVRPKRGLGSPTYQKNHPKPALDIVDHEV